MSQRPFWSYHGNGLPVPLWCTPSHPPIPSASFLQVSTQEQFYAYLSAQSATVNDGANLTIIFDWVNTTNSSNSSSPYQLDVPFQSCAETCSCNDCPVSCPDPPRFPPPVSYCFNVNGPVPLSIWSIITSRPHLSQAPASPTSHWPSSWPSSSLPSWSSSSATASPLHGAGKVTTRSMAKE